MKDSYASDTILVDLQGGFRRNSFCSRGCRRGRQSWRGHWFFCRRCFILLLIILEDFIGIRNHILRRVPAAIRRCGGRVPVPSRLLILEDGAAMIAPIMPPRTNSLATETTPAGRRHVLRGRGLQKGGRVKTRPSESGHFSDFLELKGLQPSFWLKAGWRSSAVAAGFTRP